MRGRIIGEGNGPERKGPWGEGGLGRSKGVLEEVGDERPGGSDGTRVQDRKRRRHRVLPKLH